MTNIAVYSRISNDPTGDQTATARQADLCIAFAAARGWTIVRTYEDVDLSAYKQVDRPGYRALTSDLKTNAFSGVLVWKLDRLVRRPGQFERFWELCERHHCFLTSVTEPVDSSTEIGIAFIRILVTIASLESATIALRVRARNKHAARAGQPPGGRKGYGLNQRRTAPVVREAELIRQAAQRVIAGETADAIVRDWNRQGVRGPAGGKWWDTTLKTILRSPRVAGHRDYCGEIVRRNCLPAVLDPLTAARVGANLADRHRRDQPATRLRLLGGLLRCGRCGFPLTWCTSPRDSYFCGSITGCRGIAISATAIEPHVVRQALRRATAGARGRRDRSDDENIAILQGVEQAFNAIPPTTDPARRLIIEGHRAELLELVASTEPLHDLADHGRRLGQRWPALASEEQRRQLRRYVRRITVAPATRRGGVFEPERIAVTWW